MRIAIFLHKCAKLLNKFSSIDESFGLNFKCVCAFCRAPAPVSWLFTAIDATAVRISVLDNSKIDKTIESFRIMVVDVVVIVYANEIELNHIIYYWIYIMQSDGVANGLRRQLSLPTIWTQ